MISHEGKIVRLRPLRKEDIVRSLAWRNLPEIRDAIGGYPFPVTETMEEKWYESILDDQSRTRIILAIEALADNAFIGLVHINNIDWIAGTCWFGITIGEQEYQGRGIGTESMIIFFMYAFDCLNLRKVCLKVASFNDKAVSAYTKFGFREEGIQSKQLFIDGAYHDVIFMGLFAEDFKEKYGEL